MSTFILKCRFSLKQFDVFHHPFSFRESLGDAFPYPVSLFGEWGSCEEPFSIDRQGRWTRKQKRSKIVGNRQNPVFHAKAGILDEDEFRLPVMIGMGQDGFGAFRKIRSDFWLSFRKIRSDFWLPFRKIRSDFSVFTLAKTLFWKTHRASKRLDFFTYFYDTVFLKKYFCPFLLYTFSKNEKTVQ